MEKYLFILFALMLAFTACKNSSPKEKSVSTELIMPPPAIKADEEILAKAYAPPAIREVEVAEPVGNQIMADKSAGGVDASLVKKKNVADTEKKIIKEGDIRFETSDVAKTREQIISSLKHLEGYAEDDSETTDGVLGSKEYTIIIRIPAKNFDTFLGTVSSTATKIDSRNIRIKDVTSQFIDTKARLENKLQLEKRYLNLLNRAGKMRDLLDIEEKLTEIRSDIESTQSQLNYMSKQVAYSSLNITFYTKQPEQVAAGNGFGYKLKSALISGWESLQNLFFGLLSNWYLLLVIALIIVFVKRWRGRRIAKQA
ncbi:DUF4349 domain-containing protein [Mucilaginibacter aquariorum]|uniref:DUF4349 domain-containing protein n=1 Tax=Mucilaginibacter aquariorum TaxID=2967225 RepID=A0ABT1TA77_9SPHI|nr:DUF4349 domain-containing protein [Mucilaginibacter aquariorum]MCQ6961548.1 DUF4349 domain-containing protein [Mucilaginibacter aquariorum]